MQNIFRPVSKSDIINIERKLMQTMDMILSRKKRIALDRRSHKPNPTKGTGLWGIITSVTQRPPGAESMLCLIS